MALYMLKIGMFRHYWNKFPVFETFEEKPSAGISVVVAFRNEEKSLPRLLYALNKQVYPKTLREFILVNDHSDDSSLQIALDFTSAHSGFYCLSCDEDETGKKAALQKGVKQAAFNLIAITDADCTMEDNWLSAITGICSQQNADLIIGLVDMEMKPGFFNHFQEIEFLSLVASGAAAAAGGRPLYCNAANLAFKRDLFLSYDDPFSISVPSGDDTLFMLRVKASPDNRIVLMKSAAGIVSTPGMGKIGQFFNQRSRWASKSRHYTDRDILYTAWLVLGISVVLLVSALALVLGKNAYLFWALLLGKSLIDYLFLQDFLRFYAKRVHPGLFLLFETVYPVYIVISAGMGILNRYTWKGR
jgi:cellulose synthase/poly-beta-1,6-N-acetylglucosamine synthase-like glycosyltransferase